MNISLSNSLRATEVLRIVKDAASDSTLCCQSERQFALVKIALLKSQRADLSIQLQDAQGSLLKQVIPRRKNKPESPASEELSNSQIKAIKTLESAFRQCQAEKLSIVGFSDGLVALPEKLGLSLAVLSSTSALDVDASDVYKGFESDCDED
ncbi:hypothetical protein [Motiliproteus sp. MSK22-1]|uniref:hypothetical protein n=1 Tax=Motiliproteus sp. MSK22-1 TaxID=1897630 RepID=UPI0009782A4B|nr:hypothetical protein [Motiliproteus sp. MSK22-1]OMH32699.1 hypothetical protein BGP75_14280 [Motiliproteus sp. MSK22-1]